MEEAIAEYLKRHSFGPFAPKAVLFDMDGVIYDSMPNHAVAWQKSMAEFGLRMTAEDAYATEGARGIDTITSFARRQQGRSLSEEEAQRMYDEKTRIFHSLPQSPVMPGITDVMQTVRDAGLEIGVVTGSGQRPLIARLLSDFSAFLSEERIVTAYDVKRGKPMPDPYLAGMRKAGGVRPEETIVVENAPLGIQAGAASGAFTIGVLTGPLPKHLLLEAGADIVFDNMFQLNAALRPILLEDARQSIESQ